MNKNNGKLLAAVIAMLMVVCAVAVVAAPSADAYDPVEGKELEVENSVGSVEELEALATNGIIEVPASGATIILTDDVGDSTDAADVAFILNGNLTIKSDDEATEVYDLYIKTTKTTVTSGSNNYSSVFYFAVDNKSIIVENVNLTLDNASKGNCTNSIFNSQYAEPNVSDATKTGVNATFEMKNSVVTIKQTGSATVSGSTWIGATDGDKTNLKMTGSTLNCIGTAAFQDAVITTAGEQNAINMTDVEVGLVAAGGSKLVNLTYTVNGANVQGLAFKGAVDVDNTTFDINDANQNNNTSRAGVMLYGGSEITMDDDSKIFADTMKVAGSNWKGDLDAEKDKNLVMPKIIGGTIDGATFKASTGTGDILPAKYTLSGTTLTGTNAVDENVTLASAGTGITVTENSSLRNRGTVDLNTAGLTVEGRFTNSGTVDGSKPVEGSGSVTNDGTMSAPVLVEKYTNNNTSDLSVYGDSTGTQWYTSNQNITVPEGQTWNIISGNVIVIPGTLNVLGNLVIEDGGVLVIGASQCTGDNTRIGPGTANIEGTLTVEQGATLAVAAGQINVEGTADIDGTVKVGYGFNAISNMGPNPETKNANASLNINSDTTLSDTSAIYQNDGTKVVVAQDVSLTLEGQFMEAVSIYNSGAVVIDSEPTNDAGNIIYADDMVTVYMAADGASVEVRNMAVTTGGGVTVSDAGLEYAKDKKIGVTAGTIATSLQFYVTNSSDNNSVISGLTVVEDVTYNSTKDKLTNVMDIAGNVSGELSALANSSTADTRNYSAYLKLVSGKFTVSDAGENTAALSLGEKVALDNKATLTVSGYVPVNKSANIYNSDGTLTMAGAGHVYMPEFEIKGTVNAAHYLTTVDTDDYSNYVTVDAAIAAANADSTIDEIVLYGENTVTVSATVPAIDFTFSDATLKIGTEKDRTVVLTIAAGADYNGTGTTVVEGTLYFTDRTDLRMGEETIQADVVSKQVDAEGKLVKNGWARYTNVYTAMNEAVAGDVIEVFENAVVELDSDFTVKEGVTLIVPENGQIKVMNGVTLTVAGTLQSERASQGIIAQTAFADKAVNDQVKKDYASAIVVTGTLKVMETVDYKQANAVADLTGSYISGAYYTDGEYRYVTPLAVAVSANVLPNIESKITLKGTVAEGDIVFAATDNGCEQIIVDNGAKVTLTSLALSNNAVLDVLYGSTTNYGLFTGTVTVGDASIQATNVMDLTVESENGLTVTGANVTHENDDDKVDAILAATAGTVIIGNNAVTGDMTVAEGATLTVPAATAGATSGSVSGKLIVDGTVTLGSNQSMSVGTLFVNGTVDVAVATSTATAGTLNVTGNIMYVGLNDKLETTGTGVVNGLVGCTTVYAVAGATVSDETLGVGTNAEKKSTEYVVEGATWITAYASGPVDVALTSEQIKSVPVENAYFNGTWVAEDGTTKVAVGNTTAKVGTDNFNVVTAEVTYDIYVINLRADQNAISSISIDGNLMQFGMIAEYKDPAHPNMGVEGYYYGYTLTIAAGSHTVQYQLANGYSGNGVLTVNGTQQSGLTFTTEGEPTTGSTVIYELQLTGFEKSGYVPDSPDTGSDSGDSGMGITDYLLIVLVVLIIVMAIIVAMRLMRS